MTLIYTNENKKPNAVDFIFLWKNHSPLEGVHAAGAKTSSRFHHRGHSEHRVKTVSSLSRAAQ
jgi:hypothetical protein